MANIKAGLGNGLSNDLASRRMNPLDWIAMILLIIGGINWALVGLFDVDLVARLFGTLTTASRVIYIVVGLAALYSIYLCVKQSRPDPGATVHQV